MNEEEAAETVWALASPELHTLLTRVRGWSRERYIAWLADTLAGALVLPRDSYSGESCSADPGVGDPLGRTGQPRVDDEIAELVDIQVRQARMRTRIAA